MSPDQDRLAADLGAEAEHEVFAGLPAQVFSDAMMVSEKARTGHLNLFDLVQIDAQRFQIIGESIST